MTSPSRKCFVVAAATVLALSVGACGGGGDNQVFAEGRFCELTRQFDDLLATAGLTAVPGQVTGAPEAFGEVITKMGPTLDEMQSTAPGDISGETRTVVEAVKKAQQGDMSAVQGGSFTTARQDLNAFVGEKCQTGAGSGDG